jgi:hypothetical protein
VAVEVVHTQALVLLAVQVVVVVTEQQTLVLEEVQQPQAVKVMQAVEVPIAETKLTLVLAVVVLVP